MQTLTRKCTTGIKTRIAKNMGDMQIESEKESEQRIYTAKDIYNETARKRYKSGYTIIGAGNRNKYTGLILGQRILGRRGKRKT